MIEKATCGLCGENLMTHTPHKYKEHKCEYITLYDAKTHTPTLIKI